MTQLTNFPPSGTYGDILTTTPPPPNSPGSGLNIVPGQVQDGFGNASPMTIGLNSVGFTRSGTQFFLLDCVPLLAAAVDINNVCQANPIFTGTAAVMLPSGTTSQRPVGTPGMIRYNTTTNAVEAFQGAIPAWVSL